MRRNATDIQIYNNKNDTNLSAKVPLAKIGSYSSELRKITSGNTTFTVQFNSYEQIFQREYQELINKKKF
jgi:translation elongation factor EF-G